MFFKFGGYVLTLKQLDSKGVQYIFFKHNEYFFHLKLKINEHF